MSRAAKALLILSAAGAVGLHLLLSAPSLRLWTVGSAAAVAVLSFRAPSVIPPLVASTLYLTPVVTLALTGRSHFSALTPLIGLLLASMVAAVIRRSTLPAQFGVALTCWGLVVALSWPIIALREIDFTPALLWNFRVPTAAGGFPPPAVIGWIAHVAAAQLAGFLWFEYLWIVHRADSGQNSRRRVLWPLAATALVASALGAYQGYVDLAFLSTSVWPYLRRAAGALVDANASGMLAAMWLTGFMAVAASAASRAGQVLWLFGAVAAALATWCSGSRSALAAAIVGVGVMLIASLGSVHRPRRILLAGLGALAAAALALTLVTGGLLRPQSASPLARIVASVSGGPMEVVSWLWNRDGYGAAAVRMIREFPVAGVGVGVFHSLGVDYTKIVTGVGQHPDNAQNWYRHQMAELGIVGSVGWLAFVGLFVITIVRTRPTRENSLSGYALRGGLAGLAIGSLVGMPAQHPAIIMTFWTFAFWLLQVLGVTADTSSPRAPRTGWAIVAAIVVLHATATLYSSRHDLRVPFRAARFDFDYSYGFVSEEGSQHVWVPDHAVVVPRALTRSLQLTLWSDSASEERPVGTEISIDGRRVVRRTLRGSQRLVEVVSVPGENKRFVLEVDVNPASAVRPRQRLAVQWEFVK